MSDVASNDPSRASVGNRINYSSYFETSQLFRTQQEAFQWAFKIGLRHRFVLVIANNGKRSRSSDLLASYFRCDRRGTYVSGADPNKRPKSCTKKIGCEFRIRTVQTQATVDGVPGLYWGIITFPSKGYHNHDMIDYSDGRLRHMGLDDEEKAYIEQQSQSLVAPKEIHHGLHLITPDKPRPTLRQVQDHSGKTRAEKRGDMNPAQYMLACIVENNYVHWHETNPETNELTHVFLAHPESVKLFRAYYHVILMDSTYKTNTYGCTLVEVIGVTPTGLSFLIAAVLIPLESTEGYQWLLQKLALLLEPVGKVPSTIITDRELGLINAIPLVFPSSVHLLCTWHVNRAVEGKALAFYPNPVYRAYAALHSDETGWYLVVWATSEESYFRAWKWFSAKWPLLADYVVHTWGMHHTKFVKCYTDRAFHLGNTATSRVESSHSLLKSWLKSANLKIDTMWSRIHPMLEGQHSKIRADLEKSRSKRRRNREGQLFSQLSFKVSMKAVDLMLHELERGRKLGIGLESGCGCVMKTTHGLPCACQLVELSRNNGCVHLDDIHDFWKTLSYDGESVGIPKSNDVLEGLLEEMRNVDPAQVGAYIEKLRECLHPEDSDVKEPAVRENPKGRPKKSTRRNKSAFEHARRKHGCPVTQPAVNTESNIFDY